MPDEALSAAEASQSGGDTSTAGPTPGPAKADGGDADVAGLVGDTELGFPDETVPEGADEPGTDGFEDYDEAFDTDDRPPLVDEKRDDGGVEKEEPAEKPTAAEEAGAATKFQDAPMLADLVKQGGLPPAEERLPSDPHVCPMMEEVEFRRDHPPGVQGRSRPLGPHQDEERGLDLVQP